MSLLPVRATDWKSKPLRTVNGARIYTYGQKRMELNLGLRRTYTHMFIIANVNGAILSTDFQHTLGLVSDLPGRRLRDPETQTLRYVIESSWPSITHENQDDAFLNLLKEYPSISILPFQGSFVLLHYLSYKSTTESQTLSD